MRGYPTLHFDTNLNKGTTLLFLFYDSVTTGSSNLKGVWNGL